MSYIIKYKDGAYNRGHGFGVRKFEATIYATIEDAQRESANLIDVDAIVECNDEFPSLESIVDAFNSKTIGAEIAMSMIADMYSAPKENDN